MKWITHWTTVFITVFVLTLTGLQDPYIKETLRLKSFDILQINQNRSISNDIVIINIDEKSIEQYGQWPWKRTVMADIVERVRANEGGVIVFPILFSEQDRLGGDEEFAAAIKDNGVVLAQVGTAQSQKNNAVPRGVAKIGDPLPWLFEWPGMLGPIKSLSTAAGGVGVLNTAPEIDGVTRRIPLLMKIGEEIYPALALETIRVATGDPSYQVKTQEGGITALRVPQYKTIQTDAHGRIWIRWAYDFKNISAADADFSAVKGKTVIIGTSAEGIGSTIATPSGTQYSYMAVASSLQTVLMGDNIVRYDFANFVELLISTVTAIIVVVLARFAAYWIVGAGMIALYVAALYFANYFFHSRLQLWDVSWFIITLTIVGMHAIFNRFVREFTLKQQIKKQFGGYASPMVVEMLQKNPDIIKQGIKKEVSICFSDLRGFTPLGESFGDDVKGLTEVMNGYMDAITKPVLDANGMIIKYIGDASMHIHNAPMDDPEHPKTAVQTALNMLKAVELFNETLTAKGRPAVGMGAGINTGLGYIGEMGSTQRHSYDVLGDAVSTTARLESQCKNYGVLLIVGPETYRRTLNDFFYLKLDDLAVKGKTVGLEIYTVLDLNSTEHSEDRALHQAMHADYRNQRFDAAIQKCKKLKGSFNGLMDQYYKMWQERCEYMQTQTLPTDWNGVFIATTK
jgi:adenylate cyclase